MANSFGGLGSITDMWLREPNWVKNLNEKGVVSRTLLQFFGTSQILYTENPEVPVEVKMMFMNRTKAQEYEFLSFFSTQQGRLKKYWLPEWKNRFKLTRTANSGESFIYVQNRKHAVAFQAYQRIYLLLHTGEWVTRQIASITEIDATEEKINLVTTLDRTISAASVSQSGLFLLVRMAVEKIYVEHETINVSIFSIESRELIREYP